MGRDLHVVTSLMFIATAASCGSTDGSSDGIESATLPGLGPSSAQTTEQLTTKSQSEPQVTATDLVSSAPAPGDMCEAKSEPVVAAYNIDNGDLRWVACTLVDPVRRGILDVSADVVWIELISPNGEQRRCAVRRRQPPRCSASRVLRSIAYFGESADRQFWRG